MIKYITNWYQTNCTKTWNVYCPCWCYFGSKNAICLGALMEGLFSECCPKIFSRGRNETKLHLVSKQLFTDGVLLRLAEGEAELRWWSFIFDSYHASPRVQVLCASNRSGSPSDRCLVRLACRSDPRTSTGRVASLETTSTTPRSKNTALVGFGRC